MVGSCLHLSSGVQGPGVCCVWSIAVVQSSTLPCISGTLGRDIITLSSITMLHCI